MNDSLATPDAKVVVAAAVVAPSVVAMVVGLVVTTHSKSKK